MESKPAPAGAKPILILVPHYTGSLRYFERLVPYLSEKYDVAFLLIELHRRKPARYTASHFNFEEMVSYCRDRGYAFQAVRQPAEIRGIRIPDFVYFLRAARSYKKQIQAFLRDPRIKKVVAIHDGGFYFRHLFMEAAKKNIDAMVLQWALTYDVHGKAGGVVRRTLRGRAYVVRAAVTRRLKGMFLRWAAGSDADNAKTVIGGGVSGKFGVINRQAFDYLASRGVPEKKMAIVGYMDFHAALETQKRLDADAAARAAAAAALGIDAGKKRISIFTSAYNSNIVHVFDDAGQLGFYEDIVRMIRAACPSDAYDISLKIHPTENILLYKPLERYGVRLHGKFTDNQALIYFTDLYIADSTTTSFIPIVMGKQAIFINFLKLPIIEASREWFGIKRYVPDSAEFGKLMADYASGRLERQYAYTTDIFTEDSLRKILEWIG